MSNQPIKDPNFLAWNRQIITYICNTNRQRVDTAERMESIQREFWEKNFEISIAENTFDPDTEAEVTQ